jgi:hypothetical protein
MSNNKYDEYAPVKYPKISHIKVYVCSFLSFHLPCKFTILLIDFEVINK